MNARERSQAEIILSVRHIKNRKNGPTDKEDNE
jgi:hypothetical protein